jgi:hypothetical protein
MTGRFVHGTTVIDYAGGSVGLVQTSTADFDMVELLRRADAVMYEVKKSRKGQRPSPRSLTVTLSTKLDEWLIGSANTLRPLMCRWPLADFAPSSVKPEDQKCSLNAT